MARVYVDTSAIYPALVRSDPEHSRARDTLLRLRQQDADLVTSSYVVHETIALLQRRSGTEAVRDWQRLVEPGLVVVWVDAEIHRRAMVALLAAGDRRISLTDWSSFEVMREEDIRTAFAFDDDFRGRGFDVIP
ncbi:MAG TPA: PIN domain-containing protein [Gemmatimonadota bacterium]|nr:PIN domain-containing protein [Gemmatimonadota bacterium]